MSELQHGRVTDGAAGLGSRAHVHETLARSRGAIRAAHVTAHLTADGSRALLVRVEPPPSGSARLAQASLALRSELRTSVAAYARQLRDEGVPSERMLVLVKDAVRESTPPELDGHEALALMEDVVRWSIDAYFPAD